MGREPCMRGRRRRRGGREGSKAREAVMTEGGRVCVSAGCGQAGRVGAGFAGWMVQWRWWTPSGKRQTAGRTGDRERTQPDPRPAARRRTDQTPVRWVANRPCVSGTHGTCVRPSNHALPSTTALRKDYSGPGWRAIPMLKASPASILPEQAVNTGHRLTNPPLRTPRRRFSRVCALHASCNRLPQPCTLSQGLTLSDEHCYHLWKGSAISVPCSRARQS